MTKVARIVPLLVAGALVAPALAETRPSTASDVVPAALIACAPYQDHAGALASEFGEHPVFTGQLDNGRVLRIFANTKSGSWTMLVVRTDGTSCLQSAGESGQREMGY